MEDPKQLEKRCLKVYFLNKNKFMIKTKVGGQKKRRKHCAAIPKDYHEKDLFQNNLVIHSVKNTRIIVHFFGNSFSLFLYNHNFLAFR